MAGARGLLAWIPRRLRNALRRNLMRRDGYVEALSGLDDPCADAEEVSSYPARYDVTLGIIREFTHKHHPYIAACRELGVPYKLVDISGPDWLAVVTNCACDAFLVRPPAFRSIWKQMFDERLKVMTEELDKVIYPSLQEIWLYESKRRMHYWLSAHGIPHPRTWVFYDRQEALGFVEQATLPIVYKSDLGAAASGVRIFRDRHALRRWIRRCFGKGAVRNLGDVRDREWGSVFLQEHFSEVREWRMVRIGDSYFGHLKLKKGEFHSGSGRAGWEDPPKALLDLTRDVTERGRFASMALDVFETPDGRFLVNELQTVFGFAASRTSQMIVDGKSGRYVFDAGSWRFEEGNFSEGGGYKLRVETLLGLLKASKPEPASRD
jgi:hypothetical protein